MPRRPRPRKPASSFPLVPLDPLEPTPVYAVSNPEDDLARDAASRHQLQRFGRLGECKSLRNMRPQPAFLMPPRELLQPLREPVRLATGKVAPEHAHHRSALQQGKIERQAGNVARGK